MSNFTPFAESCEIVVVDRTGKPTGETRVVNNAPLFSLLPGEPIVIIDWAFGFEERATLAEMAKPVEYNGKKYFGAYGWGSAAKRNMTYGMTRDISVDEGLARYNEDGQRFGRAFMANCLYGAVAGTLRVKFVKPGTTVSGAGPVEDGFGYATRDLVETASTGLNKITLGAARDAYHFWQRINWTPEVAAECQPFIDEALVEMSAGGFNMADKRNVSAFDDRSQFVAAEPRMAVHPWVANALARSSAEYAARTAMTVKTDSYVRVAVPARVATIAVAGKNANTRYPIDAWDSIGATDVDGSDPLVACEIERVSKLEVVQYTVTSIKGDDRFFAKGCLGIVDDLGDYDLVLCVEDRKMFIRQGNSVTIDGVFGITQWFAAGSSVGIGAAYWKDKGGDFDGDMDIVTDCSNRPALWAEVAKFPKQATHKLVKTHRLISVEDKRAEMIDKSRRNIVGMATNIASTTFAVKDRARLAKDLGYGNVGLLDSRLNFFIKAGTDLFKTDLNADDIEKQLHQLQTQITKHMGKLAPWCNWPNEWAFRHGVPEFYNAGMGTDKADLVLKNSVPLRYDGTIPSILKLTLASVKAIIDTPIESAPLKEFLGWAPRVSIVVVEEAGKLQGQFNVRSQSVNWEDQDEVFTFKSWWVEAVNEWMLSAGHDRWTAAAAMWRAAHSVRSTYAGASSVFIAFKDEALRIVTEKPGSGDVVVGVVLGLPKDTDSAEVVGEVVEFKESSKDGRRTWLRKALKCALGQFNFASDQPVPEVGAYTFTISRRSGSSWFAMCEPA